MNDWTIAKKDALPKHDPAEKILLAERGKQ